MGTLTYGSGRSVLQIDDRLLVHLRLVILSKLRRAESFAFTWDSGQGAESSVITVWMHPAIDLEFGFAGPVEMEINRQWADHLMQSANSVRGLIAVPEHEATTRADDELSASALAR
jgi:hypothetical protein